MREPFARTPFRRLLAVACPVAAAMRLEPEPDRALEPPHRAHDNLSAHAPADPSVRLVRAAWSELDQHQVSDDEPLLEFDVAHVSTSAHGLTLRTRRHSGVASIIPDLSSILRDGATAAPTRMSVNTTIPISSTATPPVLASRP